MELKEELKKGGLMALTAVIMMFVLAAIGGAIGWGIKMHEPFSIVAGIVVFVALVFGFFYYFKKKKDAQIREQKLQDEIKKLKNKK